MKHVLFLVEGDTEEFFYTLLKQQFYSTAKSKVINLNGNWNINYKIMDKVETYNRQHPNVEFTIVICLDSDSRNDISPLDLGYLKSEISKFKSFSSDRILVALAKQDIESWFFYDIENIYKFLKTPKTKRKNKYKPVDKYNHTDLSRLFKQYKSIYRKGDKSEHFLSCLDMAIIHGQCRELQKIVTLMKNF